MVLGLSTKNKRGSAVHVDYLIHIHEIKPWPPSQSLRSLRSVLIQWENGNRASGSTNAVVPSIGSVVGEGKIEFNESFKLSVSFSRDLSVRGKDSDSFLKNCLDLSLYEPRREKNQLLATCSIDLADYGVVKEALDVSAPMNCKRSFRNISPPVLFLTIQPVDESQIGASSSKVLPKQVSAGRDVSALMNEEYAEEAEFASFTDDDVSSHSSLTASSTAEANKEKNRSGAAENGNGKVQEDFSEHSQGDSRSVSQVSHTSSLDSSSNLGSPVNPNYAYASSTLNTTSILEHENKTNMPSNGPGGSVNEVRRTIPIADGVVGKHNAEDEAVNVRRNLAEEDDVTKADQSKHVKSVRSLSDSCRNNGVTDNIKQHSDAKEPGVTGDMQNGSGSFRSNGRKDSKLSYSKDSRSSMLESRIEQLERKVTMLEGELREAAAIEAALYSVVAEHGSSVAKVHAPARRLSRLYFHACNERPSLRRGSTARSAVSGLVLVAKACGNDVPRLTFWLSNAVVLRAMVNGESKTSKTPRELKWNETCLAKKDNKSSARGRFSDWEDQHTFILALEKVEAWIFSRIVESIWWQTLTPHMQSAVAKAFDRVNNSGSKKKCSRAPSSVDQDQGNFSLELWKRAFKEASERLCPLRAGGHECGCLPMLSRLIMEQCVARLDVAMCNAILRESGDEIPTDPVSDPISDSKVLPISSGKSSFGAGAQLKTTIGNWSRWLTDLFGLDDDEELDNEDCHDEDNDRHDTSVKLFHLLKSLSDLMMLPKDMLLDSSIRREVCPTFGAPLISRVLSSFVPDEFCPDAIPDAVFQALESEEPDEVGEKSIVVYPCTAPPPLYTPPSPASIFIVIGDFRGKTHLSRSGSSVTKKSNTSDDELEELNSPLASILTDGSWPSASKPSWTLREASAQNAVKYKLLREIWNSSV